MSNIAAGIPIGLAIGLGTGIGIGKKKAHDSLREYSEQHNITIQNEEGQPVSIDDFLDEALRMSDTRNKKVLFIISLVLGLLLLLGIVVFFLFDKG